MLFAKYDIFKNPTIKKSAVIAGTSLMLGFTVWRFECMNGFALDAKLPFGDGVNPPSITSSTMAIIILFISYGVFTLFAYNKYLKWITDFTSWIGKHTLYIFLYHLLFAQYIIPRNFDTDNMWLKRGIYFAGMIFGSILLEFIFKKMKYWLSGNNIVRIARNVD